MCNQDCTCVGCTVAFGKQLVSLFHIWIDITSKADDHLDNVVYDIAASTSALDQLSVYLEQDRTSPTQIFTSAGHQEIESLATRCNLIFKAVIQLAQKAADRKTSDSEKSEDADRQVWNWYGAKKSNGPRKSKKSKKERLEDEKAERERKANEKSELLIGPVPNLNSLKTLGLIGRLSGMWDWLSNRITHCQRQLRWIRKSLLLHVQMGRLTCLANQYGLSICSYSLQTFVL